MNSILNAETSAGKVLPGTDKEHSISRNPSDQGNKEPERFSTNEKRCQLIQDAIQSNVHYNIKQWGNLYLYSLLAATDESNYMGIEGAKEFFTQLLFFVARPSVSSEFNKAVKHGLDSIGRFLRWFDNIDRNYYFDEWSDYIQLELGAGDVPEDKLERLGKQYLTGAEVPGSQGKTVLNAENTVFQFDWNKVSHQPLTMEPEEKKSFEFKNDQDLVAALDRYFPNDKWPASKLEIANNPEMRIRLERLEARRVKQAKETADEKKAREVKSAISAHIAMGPNFLSLTGDPNYDVKTNTIKAAAPKEEQKPAPLLSSTANKTAGSKKEKLAGGAVRKRTGAVTKKKPAKAPAPKKTATRKKA